MSSATATRPTTGGTSSGQNFGASKVGRKGNVVVNWITSTDHKTIGYMYLIASFLFFWPVLVGEEIPRSYWDLRMWLDSWV